MNCDEPHLTPNEKMQPIQWTERPTGGCWFILAQHLYLLARVFVMPYFLFYFLFFKIFVALNQVLPE